MASPQVNPPTPKEPDWTDQVTGLVVDTVDSVRDMTTGPVLKASRGLVFGTIALLTLVFLGIAGLILAGRAIALIPIPEWMSYLIIGVVFTVAGSILMGKRFAQ